MTESAWRTIREGLAENESRLVARLPATPIPGASLCRECAHLTLGHLISCQSALLPLMRSLAAGEARGEIAIRPNPLYRIEGLAKLDWPALLSRFRTEREEWKRLADTVDPSRTLQTSHRIWSTRTLTKRLVDHERSHLAAL